MKEPIEQRVQRYVAAGAAPNEDEARELIRLEDEYEARRVVRMTRDKAKQIAELLEAYRLVHGRLPWEPGPD